VLCHPHWGCVRSHAWPRICRPKFLRWQPRHTALQTMQGLKEARWTILPAANAKLGAAQAREAGPPRRLLRGCACSLRACLPRTQVARGTMGGGACAIGAPLKPVCLRGCRSASGVALARPMTSDQPSPGHVEKGRHRRAYPTVGQTYFRRSRTLSALHTRVFSDPCAKSPQIWKPRVGSKRCWIIRRDSRI
jgi:hypothetical protein